MYTGNTGRQIEQSALLLSRGSHLIMRDCSSEGLPLTSLWKPFFYVANTTAAGYDTPPLSDMSSHFVIVYWIRGFTKTSPSDREIRGARITWGVDPQVTDGMSED